jgi:hypothetical protein
LRRLLLCALLGLSSAAFAAVGGAAAGTQFLKLDQGARPVGMGGAYVAVASGADSVLWNPAGMDQLRDLQANAGHLAYLDGISEDYLTVARPIYGLGAWGFGTDYLFVQDQGYDNFGQPTAVFNDYDFSAQVAASLQVMEDLHIGAVYKIVDEDYARQHSMGSGFDAGFQWRNALGDLDLGGGLYNFGTPIALGDYFAQLPFEIKAGGAYHLTKDWLLAIDFVHQPIDFFAAWHFGTEYGYKVGPVQTYLRAGYTIGPIQDQGDNAGLSAGLGVGLGSWQVDYAYTPQGDLGTTQRLSLTWSSWLF